METRRKLNEGLEQKQQILTWQQSSIAPDAVNAAETINFRILFTSQFSVPIESSISADRWTNAGRYSPVCMHERSNV